MTRDQISEQVRALGPWFHNMHLAGIQTAPDHPLGDYPAFKWRKFGSAFAGAVSGRTVLDIGCNGGFYAIEMRRLGASRVVAVDEDEDYLKQARFAAEITETTGIEFHRLSVYDVAVLRERFDIVLFMGVLYHLRHPLLALDLIREHAAGDLLVFQSMLRGSRTIPEISDDYPFSAVRHFEDPAYPAMHFIEHSYAGDPTNWWVPNKACAEAMLRSAGFSIESNPEDEVYVCRVKGR